MSMISFLKSLVSKTARKQRKRDQILSRYRSIAMSIGDAISYMGLGDPDVRINGKWYNVRDPELYHILDEAEEDYASLGYRIIPLDAWIDYAGWGVSIDHLWLVKREANERPIFTKLQPKRELPQRSHLLEAVIKTGEAHIAHRDESGTMHYKKLKD